jgi:outer membrane protein
MSGLKSKTVMKLQNLIALLLLSGVAFKSSGQEPTQFLSLKESCRLAIEYNVNVRNAELEQKKANYASTEAKSKLYPHVEGYSDFNYYYSIPKMILPGEIFGQSGMIAVQIGTKYDWNNGFRASQILYNQSYFTSLKLSQQLENMRGFTLLQKKEETVYQVSQVYYLCLATRKQVEQLNRTMQNTNRLLEIAKLQEEKGMILKTDYSRVLVNKSNLQTQIDNLNLLYQQQLGMLKFLTGTGPDSKVELSDSLSVNSLETSSVLPAFDNRTELQLISGQTEVARLTQAVNKQAYLPALTGIGQYYFQGQRDRFDFFRGGDDKFFKVGVVGLNLSIPVFDGFEKHSKIRQGEIEIEQLRNTRLNTLEYFSKEYKDAILQYENNLAVVMRQKENIKTAEESYTVTLQGYRQQVVTLSDLLMAESSLSEARLSYFNALLQLKNASLEVRRSKGELLNY